MKLIGFTYLLLISSFCYAGKPGKVVIEIQFTAEYKKNIPHIQDLVDATGDSITFRTISPEKVDMAPIWTLHKVKIVNNKVKLILYTNEPIIIDAPFWYRLSKRFNPGDSISISYKENEKFLSGNAIEAFRLQDNIEEIFLNKPGRPADYWVRIKSLNDYLQWSVYYDEQLKDIMKVIESYKERVPLSFYNFIKLMSVLIVEQQRADSFLYTMSIVKASDNGTSINWIAVCDSSLNHHWAKWLRANAENLTSTWYFFQYNRIQDLRKFRFDLTNDSINTKAKRAILYYQSVKQNFKALLRERLLQYVIAKEVMKELGYSHPLTATLLKDYYKEPGFPEYKKWMKEYEKIASRLYGWSANEMDKSSPAFNLLDTKGYKFTNSSLKGKLGLLNFWFTGCEGCNQMMTALKKAEEAFLGDTGVVFISVSTDSNKNQWLNSIKQKKYTTGNGINVYTEGKGRNHPMIKDYSISSYPELHLIDAWGRIQFPVPDPRIDSGVALISLLRKMRAQMNDGPYVLYKGDTTQVRYITNIDQIVTSEFTFQERIPFTMEVMSDEFPKKFKVKLKSNLEVEPSIYEKPEKQLALSDIEGNFDAFRKLLQGCEVIDDEYNWTFGKGHLILNGDIFDRGEQVTECLWLIYSLEEKAKQAGGYVHYVLGNHEILNLSGDQRYVQEKYKGIAKLLHESYKRLYSENTELGRWLRTKNVIEKVGDILYTHGGIPREVNNLPFTLQQINDLTRPQYANRNEVKQNAKIPELMILFNSRISPFWYRGYYNEANQENIIDSSLQKFGVNHIITGHTIVADTVSIHYGGKVLNTDVRHADAKSEALLIENGKYYRVNKLGERVLLCFPESYKFVGSKSGLDRNL